MDFLKGIFGDLFQRLTGVLFQVLGFFALVLVIGGGIFAYNARDNYQLSSSVLIDNPTAQTITFQLDGEEHTLDAKTSKEISLGAGEHTLVFNGETTTFEKASVPFSDLFSYKAKRNILNPTKSEYILSNQIYVSGYMSDEEVERRLPKYDCIDEKGQADKCLEKYINEVFFQEYADYGLDQPLPETAKISGKFVIYSKLFRLPAYELYLKAL